MPPYKPSSNPREYSQSNIRPICIQEIEPRGTSKWAKKYNTVHPSYHIVFILKGKIHMDAPMREYENIPIQVTYSV